MSARRSGALRRPGSGRAAGLTLATALALSALSGTSAGAVEGEELTPARPVGTPGLASSGADRSGAGTTARFFAEAEGTSTVFVRLSGRGAYEAWRAARTPAASRTAAEQEEARVEGTSEELLAVARRTDADASVLYTTSNAVPGVVMQADVAALRRLAGDRRVESISRVVPKTTSNTGAVLLTETLDQWQAVGRLGDDVSIGVIDTGIDYTHAMFGGPGTVEAYEAARADDGWTPTGKVVGGYDFAGDEYNADDTSEDHSPVPQPDPDPLDCQGHGTHVAGSAAGYGVTADGQTFGTTPDAYTGATAESLRALRIGPGTAPLADLYALRVFGCEGSTELLMEALDWALDPNGDHDFEDHLDIVNLSLGVDYGVEDDPENLFIDALAERGVLTVTSAGNAGDVTSIGGSPANAVRALSVASSVSGLQPFDELIVTEPAPLAGTYPGQLSVEFDYDGFTLDPTPVVVLGPGDEGCDPYTAQEAAAVAGKVVWVEWPVGFGCGSTARADNAANAGAVGILFSSEEAVFSAGLSGNDRIPLFQLRAGATETVRAAAEAGLLVVAFDGALQGVVTEVPELADLISPFSSRGSHGALGVVKPDLTAPGSQVASAAVGTGDGVATMSGTSMASPHVAGIAALVRQEHPDWSVEQVKAGLMNTADHDVYVAPGQTGLTLGPNRAGAGRVDAHGAVTNTLLAYSAGGAGGVSVSFGVVEVPIDGGTVVLQEDVVVQNTGAAATTASVSYAPAVEQPGVRYSVSPASVSVPAGGTAQVRVTATVEPQALRKSLEPTMSAFDPIYVKIPRQYVSDASGRLHVTRADGEVLRVPVHMAAKPVSTTTAALRTVDGQPSVVLTGTGVDQGVDGQDAYRSLVSVHQLAGTSPRLPRCTVLVTDDCVTNQSASSADIRHVGVSSTIHGVADPQEAVVTFAVSSWGDWTVPGAAMIPAVEIWTEEDREFPNVVLLAMPVRDPNDTDIFVVDAYALDDDGKPTWIAEAPLNTEWGDVDTNVFHSSVALLPVSLSILYPAGVPDDAAFEYVVSTDSTYLAPPGGDSIVDSAPSQGERFSFDPTDPDLYVAQEGASPFRADEGGAVLPVEQADGATTDKLMVVHQHGARGNRVDLLTYRTQAVTDFGPAIDWMLTNALATGYVDGFRPSTNVSRQAMAAFVHRFAVGGDAPACTTKPFPDVSVTDQFCGEIAWLKAQGLSTGYPDGTFRPTAPISRQAMAAFLQRLAGDQAGEASCVAVSGFSDVPRSAEFCGPVRWLTAGSGIASGYADGTFGPTRPVTRQAMASFLYRYAQLLG